MKSLPATLRRALHLATVLLVFCALTSGPGVQPAHAQTAASFAGLELRNIGPANMSGRVVDLAVNELNPYVIYAAAATGGVWKSTNNGVTWRPVFEKEATHSVGAIAVHPVDTAVVWVGTGERANRQSNSWGDGVYKSADGGRTWHNVGLRDSHHIGRIALHPTDSRIAYVAAMGHLWGPNEERGLYRTTDGGQSWQRILNVDTLTGVSDVAIDPVDPRIVFAATYQRMRKAFGFDGGGPGSALWKSTDGGDTWKKLGPVRQDAAAAVGARVRGGQPNDTIGSAGPNGLPIGEWGRVGISIYRKDPRIVYASVEQGYRFNASTEYTQRLAGLYRSEDHGETWTHMSDWNPRPMYASQPLVDPGDDQRVYMENAFSWSDDGGRTFTDANQSLHGDDRILWVDPHDSRHVIKGDDGGIGISYDRARTWLFVTALPVSQWYHVAVDNAIPFNIFGGLQDNGSWLGPSATLRNEGILNEDWRRLGGGDGFLALADTVEPAPCGAAGGRWVYAESQYLGVTRIDRCTWELEDIRPGDPRGHIGDRRNWDAWGAGTPEPELGNAMAPANWDGPYMISPHDASVLYAGTNKLWKSPDRGQTWIDLGDMTTRTNRRNLTIMGRRAHDHTPSLDDGIPYWPTITAIAESPIIRGTLYVGTDDGNLQVSRDGGNTWKEVSNLIPGADSRPGTLPDRVWVNSIEASRRRAGTVYVAINNYRDDDYTNYLYRSTDFGDTWESIAGNLPPARVVRAVREDRRNPDLLWLATEMGVFFSLDAGRNWMQLRANLPTVAFNDVLVHERDNDLVLASHGRGVWILDNVNAFQELTPTIAASESHLFTIEPAWQFRLASEKAHTGDMIFEGRNPPAGGIIDYWLRNAQDSTAVQLDVVGADGSVVQRLAPHVTAGVNRVVWDLRHERLPARPDAQAGARGPAGPLVAPGRYTVRLTVRGVASEKTIEVREDPRIQVSPAVLAQWNADMRDIAQLYRQAVVVASPLDPVRKRLPLKKATPGAPPGSPAYIRETQPPPGPLLTGRDLQTARTLVDQTDEWLNRIGGLYSAAGAIVGPLTADQRTQLQYLHSKQAQLERDIGALVARLAR
jgi:photosystem II stability/assembly factor-like uncharacterized protein